MESTANALCKDFCAFLHTVPTTGQYEKEHKNMWWTVLKTLLLFSCSMVLYQNINLTLHSSLLLHMCLFCILTYYIFKITIISLQLYSTWNKDNEKKSHGKTHISPTKHTVDQTSWWYKLQEIITWKRDWLFQADRRDKARCIFYTTTIRTYLKRDMHTSLTP